jgi:hypothetical protein
MLVKQGEINNMIDNAKYVRVVFHPNSAVEARVPISKSAARDVVRRIFADSSDHAAREIALSWADYNQTLEIGA